MNSLLFCVRLFRGECTDTLRRRITELETECKKLTMDIKLKEDQIRELELKVQVRILFKYSEELSQIIFFLTLFSDSWKSGFLKCEPIGVLCTLPVLRLSVHANSFCSVVEQSSCSKVWQCLYLTYFTIFVSHNTLSFRHTAPEIT